MRLPEEPHHRGEDPLIISFEVEFPIGIFRHVGFLQIASVSKLLVKRVEICVRKASHWRNNVRASRTIAMQMRDSKHYIPMPSLWIMANLILRTVTLHGGELSNPQANNPPADEATKGR